MIYLVSQFVFLSMFCMTMMFFVWIVALRRKNASMVDAFWALMFAQITLVYMMDMPGYAPRRWILGAMLIIWSLRLTLHLSTRIKKHFPKEDSRYEKLLQQWGSIKSVRFFLFFMLQGFSVAFLIFPLIFSFSNPDPNLSFIEYFAFVLWFAALCGESISDWQLRRFKDRQDPFKKVCDEGFWQYSRHPNYFFEWLIWVSYFLYALGSPNGFWAIIMPLTMLILLLKVSGIPLLEETALKTKGQEYQDYKARTNLFFPGPKKGV